VAEQPTQIHTCFTCAYFGDGHCQPDEPGHGPSWSLTHNVKGKTTTKIIPKAFVPQTREHITEYQRLRHLTSDLVEVNEKICQLRPLREVADEEELEAVDCQNVLAEFSRGVWGESGLRGAEL